MESKTRIVIIEIIRWFVHICAVLGLIFTGASWPAVTALVVGYVTGMLLVCAGFHRYFSHKTYKTSRVFQFILAFLGCMNLQRGPVWWASVHRHHHKYSDEDNDFHSPKEGFWHSHMGWLTNPKVYEIDYNNVRDLTKYPELMWLDKWYHLPALLMIAVLGFLGSYLSSAHPSMGTSAIQMIAWGFFIRTTLLWHGTFLINSLMHVMGTRRYETSDTSKNSFILSLITLGEGWHNNHHRYQSSARNGFYWWELDINFYFIKLLEALGLVWDVKKVPESVLEEGRHHHKIVGFL